MGLALVALAGCRSPGEPGGTTTASVKIQGATPEQIRAAIDRVFAEAGFNVGKETGFNSTPQSGLTRLFERRGDRADALKFGGWDGTGVMMRVRVFLESMGDAYLLSCNVVAVRNYSDKTFGGDENPVFATYRAEYQGLLNKVKQQVTPQ